MANQRFESTPIFKVDDDPVIIQAAAGSSSNLLVLKASDGTTLSSVGTTGALIAPTATAGTNTNTSHSSVYFSSQNRSKHPA